MTFPLPNFRTVAQELALPAPAAAPAALPPAPAASPAPVVPPPPPPVQTPPPAATQAPVTEQPPTPEPPPEEELGDLQKDQNGNALATIISRQDGNYLTVLNGAQDDATPVIVQSKQNQQNQPVALNQFWVLVGYDDGSMALSPGNAAGSALTRDGDVDQLRIRTVSGGDGAIRQGRVEDNQRWTFTESGDDTVLIVNAATGECLTNAGADQQARAIRCEDRLKPLQQWTLGDS
nr:RICIN domain-containing protein [Kineosporia babensis]